MIINNNTIEYKEKLELQYNQRMNALLTELPSFCTEYEIYLRNKNSLKTRMEYIFDIYNFFKYLVKVNAGVKTVSDASAEILEKLTGADFDKYLDWLSNYKFDEKNENEKRKSNSQASKKRKIMSIKSLYSFLFIKEYISCNPALEATVPKVTKKPREEVQLLSEAQCKSFLNIIDVNYKRAKKKLAETPENKQNPKDKMRPHLVIRDKAIVLLILSSGLRVSEVCSINCGDISFNTGTLDVVRMGEGDGKTVSRIELSEEVLDILKHYLYDARDNIGANEDNFDALFLSSIHRRITPRSVELMVKKYAAEALGKDHTVHPRVLRATFESRNTVAD